jgi:hypothetical protein
MLNSYVIPSFVQSFFMFLFPVDNFSSAPHSDNPSITEIENVRIHKKHVSEINFIREWFKSFPLSSRKIHVYRLISPLGSSIVCSLELHINVKNCNIRKIQLKKFSVFEENFLIFLPFSTNFLFFSLFLSFGTENKITSWNLLTVRYRRKTSPHTFATC